ncbi:hypothetical protein [Brevibacillus laterosporus]|uniref:hypothetical protein n=1 Tax=Brevibacillus laterosporus TaxID=1465 RepID=UPI0002150820
MSLAKKDTKNNVVKKDRKKRNLNHHLQKSRWSVEKVLTKGPEAVENKYAD